MKTFYLNFLLATFSFCLCGKPQNVQFVHIGKAGGTSARIYFARTFRGTSLNISYVHCHKPDIDGFDTFIVTVRNPIDRIVSWFLHVHPKNKILAHRMAPQHTQIFDCYEEINDLATHGLERKISSKLDNCQRLARNVITGNVPGSYEYAHVVRNYRFYISKLLSQAGNKNIYVLRTEHQIDDWISSAEDIVHQSGVIANVQMENKHITHREGKKPAVTNRGLSKEGLKNACFFLCPEIQLFKEIIKKAINLNEDDKEWSLQDLAKYCPKEVGTENCDSAYHN